ncbi:hypothetical protein RFI_39413 [Reticulomyxa filosa]|uniref:PH domain-containing protein n=1 Tax=Reticulomyxa filosa TaxID=46433 RepID=X6L838_RETFI|nr:hypothetical protein RFI_39413 [Reticulomyxa filosa]|eukprot:ETN98107.1 hypothetical protein RFI_39413 [Reticulomyxa filosa]
MLFTKIMQKHIVGKIKSFLLYFIFFFLRKLWNFDRKIKMKTSSTSKNGAIEAPVEKIIDDELLEAVWDLDAGDVHYNYGAPQTQSEAAKSKEIEEHRQRYLQREHEREKQLDESIFLNFHSLDSMKGAKVSNCDEKSASLRWGSMVNTIDEEESQSKNDNSHVKSESTVGIKNARNEKLKQGMAGRKPPPMLGGTVGQKPDIIHQTSNIYKSTFHMASLAKQQRQIVRSPEQLDNPLLSVSHDDKSNGKKFPEMCHYRVVHQGYLKKKGYYNKSWKQRYCLLLAQQIDINSDNDHGPIIEYDNEQDQNYVNQKMLQHYHILTTPSKTSKANILIAHKLYIVCWFFKKIKLRRDMLYLCCEIMVGCISFTSGSKYGIVSSAKKNELPKCVNVDDLISKYGIYIVTVDRIWVFDCSNIQTACEWVDVIANVKNFFRGFTFRDWNLIPEHEDDTKDENVKASMTQWAKKVEEMGMRRMGINNGFGDWCFVQPLSTASKSFRHPNAKVTPVKQSKKLKYVLFISNPHVSQSFQGLLLFDVDYGHFKRKEQRDDLYLHIHAILHPLLSHQGDKFGLIHFFFFQCLFVQYKLRL